MSWQMLMPWILAFVIGGALCVIAQLLIDLSGIAPARILVTYVVAGVILTGLGWYQPLVDLAGCGATTPLTGFGFALARGVERAVEQQGAVGIITGGISGAAGGITVAMVFGYLMALLFSGKRKR